MAGGSRKNADSTIITLLAGESTIHDTAAKSGVSERTVFRRLEDPGFRKQVSEARGLLPVNDRHYFEASHASATPLVLSLSTSLCYI